MKVGYFLIFIFAILNFLGLKQTEFEIRQLDSTARILTTHAEAVQAAQEQPTLNAAAASTLTRADTQIAIASFSNENVAGEAKRLASLCNANIKEKSITASVSNDAVLEEMARRPNMYGRLVIPSVPGSSGCTGQRYIFSVQKLYAGCGPLESGILENQALLGWNESLYLSRNFDTNAYMYRHLSRRER